MRFTVFAILLAFLSLGHEANAACSGTTNGTPTTNATLTGTYFANGRPAGAITPDCIRDAVASLAPQTGIFTGLPTSPAGLVSGQYWLNGTTVSVVP